jgi:hypothetical protein
MCTGEEIQYVSLIITVYTHVKNLAIIHQFFADQEKVLLCLFCGGDDLVDVLPSSLEGRASQGILIPTIQHQLIPAHVRCTNRNHS